MILNTPLFWLLGGSSSLSLSSPHILPESWLLVSPICSQWKTPEIGPAGHHLWTLGLATLSQRLSMAQSPWCHVRNGKLKGFFFRENLWKLKTQVFANPWDSMGWFFGKILTETPGFYPQVPEPNGDMVEKVSNRGFPDVWSPYSATSTMNTRQLRHNTKSIAIFNLFREIPSAQKIWSEKLHSILQETIQTYSTHSEYDSLFNLQLAFFTGFLWIMDDTWSRSPELLFQSPGFSRSTGDSLKVIWVPRIEATEDMATKALGESTFTTPCIAAALIVGSKPLKTLISCA